MNTQSLIVLATLAFAGTAAMADDITMVNDKFISTKTRAEVKAEVLKARAAGVLQFSTEMQAQVDVPFMPSMPATATATAVTREQVRSQVRAQTLRSPPVQAGELFSAT